MPHLLGGISSAGRAVPEMGGAAFLVTRAEGPYLHAADGRRYVDTALGFGATLLGHADPEVDAAVIGAIRRGSMPAFAHAREEAAAAALCAPCVALSQAVFTSSGSEAVHLACRVARAVTGRGTIAKVAGGFDGWFDPMAFGNAGAPEALIGNAPRPRRHGTVLTRFNDPADLQQLFDDSDDIAAIILEPLLANAGCIPADPAWLAAVQTLARKHGALVIADEVLSGFRGRFGLMSQGLGLQPDLATLGKAIGNGYAVAAVIGRPDVMAAAADGRAVRAGTYAGNPLATAAVVATLARLAVQDYAALAARGDRMRGHLVEALVARGITATTLGLGMVFTPWFAADPPRSYEEAAAAARPDRTLALHLALRDEGVMTMPGAFGRWFLGFAHDDAVIGAMADAVRKAAMKLPRPPARR
ncbi:aminotransferase class III-fold pyridoxal phosphate-dependent enzyme [Rhodobacter sp. Har01]|uniref:aminotransferase class III-fold pyridoxal phosphate-dependent enzyme n=1 Tax=Rhodobacter sp. Har01 TaxID=2883999 RepID=UPI001D090512|nr:aminotransferase class III-fold pyridoxal phosphate-dependent enzyme [Rhodobacter sp. Har01]MCB6179079.1 aminotransferase class III-fold pyridoxal phosphate-dependent enzyme [Rhodobacter sp. Har01]